MVWHIHSLSHTPIALYTYVVDMPYVLGFWKKVSSGIVEGESAQAVKCTSDGRRDRRPIYTNYFSFFLKQYLLFFFYEKLNFFNCIRQ